MPFAIVFWQALRKRLDSGRALPLPDGLLINGASKGLAFTGEHGKFSLLPEILFPFKFKTWLFGSLFISCFSLYYRKILQVSDL